MRSRTMHLALATLWLAALLLAACGGGPAAPAAGTSPANPAPETTAVLDAPTAASGLSVTDALGRSVTFASPPTKIALTGKSSLTIVETAFLFAEAQDRVTVIGMGKQDPGEFLSLVDPGYAQVTGVSHEAGPEQLAPLQPDVVVLRSFMADSLGASLDQVSIPVVYVDLETPEQYFRDVTTLGQLFGNEARAREITEYYQGRLDYVNTKLAGLDAADKPRVLLMQYGGQGGEISLQVPSASWLQTIEAELAGGQPVWADAARAGGWTVVNLEQIAAWNPEQIYIISYQADPAEVVEQLRANPQWQELQAVQAGQIYGFPGDFFSWDQPDPRWILGVTWLAGKMHPERFADLDMTEEVISFFGQMYGLDEATVRANVLPRLRGNVE